MKKFIINNKLIFINYQENKKSANHRCSLGDVLSTYNEGLLRYKIIEKSDLAKAKLKYKIEIGFLPAFLDSIRRAVLFEDELYKRAIDSTFFKIPPALLVCFSFRCKFKFSQSCTISKSNHNKFKL